MDVSRWPRITICCSFSCFATCVTPTRGDDVSPGPGRHLACYQTQAPPAPARTVRPRPGGGTESLVCSACCSPDEHRFIYPGPATVANALELGLARTNCHVCSQAHPRRRAKPSPLTPAASEDAGSASTTSQRLQLLLTSLAEEPETSIHVLEKKAQEPSMNTMYTTAWTGSSKTEPNDSGGDR